MRVTFMWKKQRMRCERNKRERKKERCGSMTLYVVLLNNNNNAQ